MIEQQLPTIPMLPSVYTYGGRVRTILAVRSCDCGLQGPENLILTLAEDLRTQGVRYVIANLWDGQPPQVALHEEAVRRGLESHVVATTWDLDPAVVSGLRRLLRWIKPDVIHTHDVKSEMVTLAARQGLRIPLVGSFYGRLAMRSLFLKLADVSRFGTFRLFDRLLANSEAQRRELLQWRVPSNKIDLVPSFVDTEQFRPPTPAERAVARRALQLELDQPVLATVARLSPNKGHSYMLQALPAIKALVPNVVYLVPGEGDAVWHGEGGFREELERQAEVLGVAAQVRFLGYYPYLHHILHAADLIVSPSLREGMQVSLLEAMASGRSVVATAIGGTPDAVVDQVTGLLVPPEDAVALSEACLRLINDPELRQSMSHAARLRAVTRFDTHVVAAQVLNVCEQVVHGT